MGKREIKDDSQVREQPTEYTNANDAMCCIMCYGVTHTQGDTQSGTDFYYFSTHVPW